MGALAGVIGANAALSGARQLLKAQPPKLEDLLLAPANALRIADKLSHMRGAAMKLGQLLSMDAGQVLPPEWSSVLQRLQADAAPMPPQQLEQQLTRNWGRDWRQRFESFAMQPIAAASIGQVHRARTREGRDLAIKVQYPGVAASIDSDLDNIVSVLRLSRAVPAGIDLAPLVAEARRQLRQEADYLAEAAFLTDYRRHVAADVELLVPDIVADLTGPSILAMDFIPSEPIDRLEFAPQAERDRLVTKLVRLTLDEVFSFGLMQTDPNFANFRYQPLTGRLVLLDFGATRPIPAELSRKLLQLLRAALAGDAAAQRAAMIEIGYFAPHQHRLARIALELLALGMGEVLATSAFDFHAADLPRRARDIGLAAGFDKDLWSVPPVDTLFIHRKIGGIYLLAARLRARVNLRALFEEYGAKVAA